jgi:tRNA pseudouridine38-40 synthase
MRIALKLAYNGKNYHGFARQPNVKTIEGSILNSFKKQGLIDNIKDSKIRYASRTDKGVSAFDNVIVINTKLKKNDIQDFFSYDYKNIVFYGIKDVKINFDPRYAVKRIYRYYLKSKNIDFNKINLASSLFIGKHDFRNFARIESNKNPVRTIENIIISKQNNFIFLDFHSENFLWHQIRRIVSAILKFEKNILKKEQILEALENPDKKIDFGISSPYPLILKNIIYNFNFEYNEKKIIELKEFKNKIIDDLNIFYFKSD